MTVQNDVDAQVTIDATTSAAAIVAATSAVSGYAFSITAVAVALGDFASTDAVITEIAVRMLHRHQDNLKFQGVPQMEFNPVVKLTQVDRDTIKRTMRKSILASSLIASTVSPTGKGLDWTNPDWGP